MQTARAMKTRLPQASRAVAGPASTGTAGGVTRPTGTCAGTVAGTGREFSESRGGEPGGRDLSDDVPPELPNEDESDVRPFGLPMLAFTVASTSLRGTGRPAGCGCPALPSALTLAESVA